MRPDRLGVVAGREVPGVLLDARLAELRAGPLADRLPPPDCLEGRRLRRWVAQLVLTEELVRAEAARLGVRAGAPEPAGEPGQAGQYGRSGRYPAPTGSLAAAVLAAMPLARAVYRRITETVRVDEAAAEAYHRRNPELWQRPERRTVLYLPTEQPNPSGSTDRIAPGYPSNLARLRPRGVRWTCTAAELPEPLDRIVFTTAPGNVVGPTLTPFGWQLYLIEGVTPAHTVGFDTVRDEILTMLTLSARQRYFEQWLERRRRTLVTVASGCEHPGDPRHSDYAHNH